MSEALIYGLGNALARFCGLLVFPFYARILSYEEFAAQDLALSFGVFLVLLAGMGFDTAFTRLFNERNKSGRVDLATTWGVLTLLASLPIIMLALACRGHVLAVANIDLAEAGALFTSIIIASGVRLMLRQATMILRLRQQPLRFVIVSIATAATHVGFAIFFVVVLRWGIVGVGMANMLSALIGLGVAIFVTGWIWSGKFCRSDAKQIITYGLPFLPAALSVWGLEGITRIILQNVTDPSQTAIYAVGTRVAAVIAVILFGFQMSWQVHSCKLMKESELPVRPFISAANWLWYLGGSAVAILGIFGPELIFVLAGDSYSESRHVVYWIGFSMLLWTFFYIASTGYQYAMKSKHNIHAVVSGLLVVIVASPFAAKYFGATGVAIMSFLGYWVAVVIAARKANRYEKIDFRWKRIGYWQAFLIIVCVTSGLYSLEGASSLPELIFVGSLKILGSMGVMFIGYRLLLDNCDRDVLVGRLNMLRGILNARGR